jgi:hypothetical protein
LRQRSFLRQQLHPSGPQHAVRRLLPSPQQILHPESLQKSPPFCRQRCLSASIVTSWASAPREAKSPIAEATSAAPVSFIALPREIAPVSRPLARSSKDALSRNAGRASPSLLVNNRFLLSAFPSRLAPSMLATLIVKVYTHSVKVYISRKPKYHPGSSCWMSLEPGTRSPCLDQTLLPARGRSRLAGRDRSEDGVLVFVHLGLVKLEHSSFSAERVYSTREVIW